jgi:hypothetical protein
MFRGIPSLFLLIASLAGSAAAGQARLFLSCTSVAVLPETEGAPRPVLAFSAFADGVINNEVAFTDSETNTSHSAYGYLSLPGTNPPVLLSMGINVPGLGDTDNNALTDAFDVGFGFTNALTTGSLAYPVGPSGTNAVDGVLETTWSRRSGVTTGVLVSHLVMPALSLDLRLTNNFEIFQYVGPLGYTVTRIGDDAYANLNRIGAPGTLQGPLDIEQVDPFDFAFSNGAWTNESGLPLNFYSTADIGVDILKGPLPGYFNGLVVFDNGLPQFLDAAQYQVWNFDLFDTTSVPGGKFSDIVGVGQTPAPAMITLRPSGTNLAVWATGPNATAAVLQTAPSPAGPWSNGPAVKLSHRQQVLATVPAGPATWFRLH